VRRQPCLRGRGRARILERKPDRRSHPEHLLGVRASGNFFTMLGGGGGGPRSCRRMPGRNPGGSSRGSCGGATEGAGTWSVPLCGSTASPTP
jgi:hypothetical protein